MIDFVGYRFDDDKGCFTCQHVMDGAPVLLIVHERDGDLQLVCGEPGHEYEDCVLLHLTHLLESQLDLRAAPKVEIGQQAERFSVGSQWTVSRSPEYE